MVPEMITDEAVDDQALTTEDLSERWQMTRSNLAMMRYRKMGPAYFKIGKRVYYKLKDVEEYESQQRISTKEQQ